MQNQEKDTDNSFGYVEGAKIDSSVAKPFGGRSETERKAALDYANKISPRYRGNYLRAVEGTASPRSAIKAHCYECIGHQNVVAAISDCQGYRCALYAYRPYQDKDQVED